MSKESIEKRVYECSEQLLREKGYVSPVELLVKMDRLSEEQVVNWRLKKIPYLERGAIGNLSKLQHILKTLGKYGRENELRPSKTVYMSWGKGQKQPLRFTKLGSKYLEELYSTHFVLKNKNGL